jgi:5-methylthioadenosine/S-adenosylhomocysteine deaminase
MTLGIRARWGWLPHGDQVEVVNHPELILDGNKIVSVSTVDSVSRHEGAAEPERWLDLPEHFLLPGFINAHSHVGSSPPLRGIAEDMLVKPGSGAALFQLVGLVSALINSPRFADDFAVFAEWDVLQMLRSGVTTILNETASNLDRYIEVAERVGVRTYASTILPASNRARGYLKDGRLQYDASAVDLEQELEAAIADFHRYDGRGGGLIRGKLSPHAPDTCSPELLLAARRGATELGCPMTIHASQSDSEVKLVRERYGKTPLQHLYDLSFLAPDVLITHASHPQEGDLALLRDSGATVVHCPTRKAREAVLAPYVPFLEGGVRVALGTDAFNADYVEDMRSAALYGKMASRTISRPTARDVLQSATRAATDALGRPDLGRIAPGATADLVAIRLDGTHVWPVFDPVRSLVYYGLGSDVDTVIVDGQIVLHAGAFTRLDEQDARRRVQEAAQRLWKTADAEGALPRD